MSHGQWRLIQFHRLLSIILSCPLLESSHEQSSTDVLTFFSLHLQDLSELSCTTETDKADRHTTTHPILHFMLSVWEKHFYVFKHFIPSRFLIEKLGFSGMVVTPSTCLLFQPCYKKLLVFFYH